MTAPDALAAFVAELLASPLNACGYRDRCAEAVRQLADEREKNAAQAKALATAEAEIERLKDTSTEAQMQLAHRMNEAEARLATAQKVVEAAEDVYDHIRKYGLHDNWKMLADALAEYKGDAS